MVLSTSAIQDFGVILRTLPLILGLLACKAGRERVSVA